MDSVTGDLAEAVEALLPRDVTDVELERAANPANRCAVTWAICTYPVWYCDLPQERDGN